MATMEEEKKKKSASAFGGAAAVGAEKTASDYKTVWSTANPTPEHLGNFYEAVEDQKDWYKRNPTSTQSLTDAEFQDRYGGAYTTAPNGSQVRITELVDVGAGGSTTKDEATATRAREQGFNVTQSYNKLGQLVYHIDGAPRTAKEGTSGADESLLNSRAYAALQYEQQQFADAQAAYKQAAASGDRAAMDAAQQIMDEAHLYGERNRAGSWLGGYSGGADGSMYMGHSLLEEDASGGSGGSTGSSGTSAGSLSVSDYSQYLQDLYDAKKQAEIAALEAAYQQNLADISRAGEGLDKAYQDARNQTAGASELAKRNAAQYAAAHGLSSGTGSQAELARNVTLQNNLNSINAQEAQSLADLDLQRSNAEIEYNQAIAQAQANGDYELANALYQEKIRYETARNAAIQQEFENALAQYRLEYQQQRDQVADSQWQQSFDASQAQQDWENRFNQTQYDNALLQQDWENRFNQTQYNKALGQQAFENNLALAKFRASMAADSKPVLTYSQVMSAIENGNVTPAVKEAFEYYNGISYDAYYGEQGTVPSTVTGLLDSIVKQTGVVDPVSARTRQQMNAQVVDQTLARMQAAGAGEAALRAALNEAYQNGDIPQGVYKELYSKYFINPGA